MAQDERRPVSPRDAENREWIESLDDVHREGGAERVREILWHLHVRAQRYGVRPHFTANTPYVNSIPPDRQPPYPGNREIERRIKSLVRWNAMAMVVRANREAPGIGGHISTFASAATLYEVGFNHFFRGKGHPCGGDIVYFQGHSAPGIYARAYLEGRLSEEDLAGFRRELRPGGGLSSYPHPYLMPAFWEFPTVSMGLAPLMAIYQARFNHYLVDRGLKKRTDQKVWAFLGDGEMDEPESLGAITLASREKLDNLVFVVNCNLQRLDGPVRGNGKMIQELEAAFRGAGWNVLKVIWGSDWDPLLEHDDADLLVKRMEQVVDGQYQRYLVSDGAFIRQDFFGSDPRLLERVAHHSDEQLRGLKRGGHDPEKVYAAFKAAVEHAGSPTVVLAHTVKGYGLGEAGEGKNITHQQKKLNEQELKEFRTRFAIPLSDEDVAAAPFYRPPEESAEIRYLRERREALGGYFPVRTVNATPFKAPPASLYEEFFQGTGEREMATTMAFVHLLAKLLKDPKIGKLVVPIVPDEARTFGMESLFRQVGIYSHSGQLYDPVDKESLLYYKEATDGAILEEGITEAGGMASFIAAGTAYSAHGIPTVPFFIFYSMFGLQRIGDLVWAASDMGARGFLMGGTSGRTTLAGEGLQHQDGNSHLLAYPVPHLKAYDPCFAYELAVIVREGLARMFERGENLLYYVTVMNEFYRMPALVGDSEEGILKGLYRFRASGLSEAPAKAALLGSGSILNEALKAAALLEEKYGVAAEVYSATSFKELHREALEADRWNRLHPQLPARTPYVAQTLAGGADAFVAATDYVKAVPLSVGRWVPGPFAALGTDGFGRSDTRQSLRGFFEVDARSIAFAALSLLAREKKIDGKIAGRAAKELEIDAEKPDPAVS